ncbi:hypothetical protein [Caldimonas brevitalea]|uniref:Uncharacterized protein n=1 Tax=Caldimonas brevitalea TaxID=413882 RepID=A0A0G3BN45_9BURK|nr:hypothetical protein [Caldimonas brevitalea]AKJ28766.1 hypothetical protein AAW51_2075 [Caldimonas brevitalea]
MTTSYDDAVELSEMPSEPARLYDADRFRKEQRESLKTWLLYLATFAVGVIGSIFYPGNWFAFTWF